MSADRAIKEPCRVATTGAITLHGAQTIDGLALSAGDRVLVRAQASAIDNGIWQVALGTACTPVLRMAGPTLRQSRPFSACVLNARQ